MIATKTDKKSKPDASAKTNIRLSPPSGQYVFKVQFDDGSHDVASLFGKATYYVKISIGVIANALMKVKSLLDTGASPNLIKKDFLPQAWKDSMNSIKSRQLRTVKRKVVHIDGIVTLLICMDSLHVCAWIGTGENLVVNVLLGTQFIDLCIRRILHTDRKIILWHWKPVEII